MNPLTGLFNPTVESALAEHFDNMKLAEGALEALLAKFAERGVASAGEPLENMLIAAAGASLELVSPVTSAGMFNIFLLFSSCAERGKGDPEFAKSYTVALCFMLTGMIAARDTLRQAGVGVPA